MKAHARAYGWALIALMSILLLIEVTSDIPNQALVAVEALGLFGGLWMVMPDEQ